jgi:hypothetical protein
MIFNEITPFYINRVFIEKSEGRFTFHLFFVAKMTPHIFARLIIAIIEIMIIVITSSI